MAFLYCDSFDHYVTADMGKKWNSATAKITAAQGRNGSAALEFDSTEVAQKVLTPGDNTIIIGFAKKPTSGNGSNGWLLIGDASVQHIKLIHNGDGTFSVYKSPSTLLGTTSAACTLNSYDYWELKVTIHDSAGVVIMRKNGVVVLNLTAQDTQNGGSAGWTNFLFNAQSILDNGYYDDLYVLDGTGSAPYNDFLGDVRVSAHYPNAVGSNNGSTPSSGTDRNLTVDEVTANGDTDYNTLAPGTAKDTFGMGSLLVSGAAILAFQPVLMVKKTDAGTGSIAPVIRHSGTDYDGNTVAVSTGYGFIHQPYVVNPGTSAQLTESEFNAMEVGYHRMS